MHRKIIVGLFAGLLILGIKVVSSAMTCGGNQLMAQAHGAAEHGAGQASGKEASASATAVDAGNKTCPVSGEKINERLKATYEYEGKIYNFCCAMCIDSFKENPRKYIKKVEEELQAASKGQSEEKQETSAHGGHEGHHH